MSISPSSDRRRRAIASAVEAVGLAAVTVGVGLIWVPLGVIAGGVLAVAAGWALDRDRGVR